MVLKELIFNSFHFGRGCGGPERIDSSTVSTLLRGCVGPERTDFQQVLLWAGCGSPEGTNF